MGVGEEVRIVGGYVVGIVVVVVTGEVFVFDSYYVFDGYVIDSSVLEGDEMRGLLVVVIFVDGLTLILVLVLLGIDN